MSGTLQRTAAEAFPRISIIGAGIGGLALAWHLHGLQIPFKIYESRTAQSIGHSYGLRLSRKAWRSLGGNVMSKSGLQALRKDTAVDRLKGGDGKVFDSSKQSSASFFATDRDLRAWLVNTLVGKGVQVSWEHNLTEIRKPSNGEGAELVFEDKAATEADLVVDAAGLRSPAFGSGLAPVKPRLLPYVTYTGTRRVTTSEYLERYDRYFRSGNMIESHFSDNGHAYIQLKKTHLDSEDGKGKIELRWIYSRPPREGEDPLWRPDRAPAEAKNIPQELIPEILETIQNVADPTHKKMLKEFFNLDDLSKDRTLNWHLRVRLPEPGYFSSNTHRGTYGVLAIGDAAHGLPIVCSNGAEDALLDARYLAETIRDLRDRSDITSKWPEKIFGLWYSKTNAAIQRLREVHGQEALGKTELHEAIGFSFDGPETSKEEFEDSDSEADQVQEREKL